jgi:hypothetical protein
MNQEAQMELLNDPLAAHGVRLSEAMKHFRHLLAKGRVLEVKPRYERGKPFYAVFPPDKVIPKRVYKKAFDDFYKNVSPEYRRAVIKLKNPLRTTGFYVTSRERPTMEVILIGEETITQNGIGALIDSYKRMLGPKSKYERIIAPIPLSNLHSDHDRFVFGDFDEKQNTIEIAINRGASSAYFSQSAAHWSNFYHDHCPKLKYSNGVEHHGHPLREEDIHGHEAGLFSEPVGGGYVKTVAPLVVRDLRLASLAYDDHCVILERKSGGEDEWEVMAIADKDAGSALLFAGLSRVRRRDKKIMATVRETSGERNVVVGEGDMAKVVFCEHVYAGVPVCLAHMGERFFYVSRECGSPEFVRVPVLPDENVLLTKSDGRLEIKSGTHMIGSMDKREMGSILFAPACYAPYAKFMVEEGHVGNSVPSNSDEHHNDCKHRHEPLTWDSGFGTLAASVEEAAGRPSRRVPEDYSKILTGLTASAVPHTIRLLLWHLSLVPDALLFALYLEDACQDVSLKSLSVPPEKLAPLESAPSWEEKNGKVCIAFSTGAPQEGAPRLQPLPSGTTPKDVMVRYMTASGKERERALTSMGAIHQYMALFRYNVVASDDLYKMYLKLQARVASYLVAPLYGAIFKHAESHVRAGFVYEFLFSVQEKAAIMGAAERSREKLEKALDAMRAKTSGNMAAIDLVNGALTSDVAMKMLRASVGL